jgi:hypothetical protein
MAPSRPTESLEQVLRRCAEYAPSRAKACEPTGDGPEEGDVKWRDDHAAYKAKHGLTDDILKDNGSFMAQAALAFLPRQREALWLRLSKDLKEHGLPWEQGRPPEPDMQLWVWRPPPFRHPRREGHGRQVGTTRARNKARSRGQCPIRNPMLEQRFARRRALSQRPPRPLGRPSTPGFASNRGTEPRPPGGTEQGLGK